MPNMDGITAIGRIKAERPETEIVTMTSFIEEDKVTAALEAGASGYVLKDAEAEEVAAAVRAAFAGEVHLDPAVARLLAQRMRQRKSPEDALAEPLTDREKDVLRPARAGDEQQGDRHAPCSSPNGRRGPTSRTSSASSASRRGPRRRCTRSSTSWSTARRPDARAVRSARLGRYSTRRSGTRARRPRRPDRDLVAGRAADERPADR